LVRQFELDIVPSLCRVTIAALFLSYYVLRFGLRCQLLQPDFAAKDTF
jgi:hypothetical protein